MRVPRPADTAAAAVAQRQNLPRHLVLLAAASFVGIWQKDSWSFRRCCEGFQGLGMKVQGLWFLGQALGLSAGAVRGREDGWIAGCHAS